MSQLISKEWVMDNTRVMLELSGSGRSFVVDVDVAVKVMNLLSDCEVYETQWHSETKAYTKHVYTPDESPVRLALIPNGMYAMCKAAGKPERN
jgi:hypothetical protein